LRSIYTSIQFCDVRCRKQDSTAYMDHSSISGVNGTVATKKKGSL
jgi:hypothetical protein